MFSRIFLIASNTFKDVARHKMLVIQLVFLGISCGLYFIFGHAAKDNPQLELKMIQDVGLSAISLFGFLISLFIGSTTLRDEINSRTIYSVITLPMGRWELYTGKFLGTLAATVVNVLIMLVMLTILIYSKFHIIWTGFHWIALFMLMEFAVMTGMVLLFSLSNSLITCFSLSILFTLLGTMAEHIQHQISEVAATFGAVFAEITNWIVKVVYWIIPNFGLFDIKYKILKDLTISGTLITEAVLYAFLYLIFLLALGSFALNKKDL